MVDPLVRLQMEIVENVINEVSLDPENVPVISVIEKLLSSLRVVDLPFDFFISALFEGVQDTVPETGLKLD